MKKLSNGNLYTRDEFRERVENGDWTGKWLSPSSFTLDEVNNKNMEYTHVIWYNK